MQMNSQDEQWLAPALDVVKRVEPATYDKMQAEYWPVHVVDGPDDIKWVLNSDGPLWWASIMQSLPVSYGITLDADSADAPDDLRLSTFLNRPDIIYRAGKLGVSVEDFTADVLVHEFTHRDQAADEPTAFEAGTKFGRELGSWPIAQLSEDTARTLEEYEE